MNASKSFRTLVVGLCILLILALTISLNATTSATAFGEQPIQQNSSDPIRQGDEEKDEDRDEEREQDENKEEDEDDEEREDDEEWDEEEERDIEMEAFEMEMERVHIETNIGRLDMVSRLTEIASNDESMAGYAIMHVGEFLNVEESLELLEKVKSDSDSKSVRNLAKMKLAELYAELDEEEKVKEILYSILTNQ